MGTFSNANDLLIVANENAGPNLESLFKMSANTAGKRGKRDSPWGQFNPNWIKKTGT